LITAPDAVTSTLPLASDFQPLNVVDRGSALRAMVGPVLVAFGKPEVVVALVVVVEVEVVGVEVDVAFVVVDEEVVEVDVAFVVVDEEVVVVVVGVCHLCLRSQIRRDI
jgi:hypothetical protein